MSETHPLKFKGGVEDACIIYAHDKKKNKYINAGIVNGNRFYKYVKPAHFMVKHNAYGIQSEVLNELIKRKVVYIVINTSRGARLTSRIELWINQAVVKDYGNGVQHFLNIKLMND